jgi:virginiamycin B lyase
VIEVYDLPTPGSEPHGITLGPDGALWTALEVGALARVTVTPTVRGRTTPEQE